jgi:hypothetical protein
MTLGSKKSVLLMGMFMGCLFITACTKFQTGGNERTISTHGDDESHYNGWNCMHCHAPTATGEGWFTTAGTVSDPGNGQVEFFKELGAEPIMTVEVDGLGNFYTTETLDFPPEGLFVGLRDPQGNLEIMGRDDDNPDANIGVGPEGQIYNGGCNLCHGYTTDILEY